MDKENKKLNSVEYHRFEASLYYAFKSIEQEAFVYGYSDVPEYQKALEQLKERLRTVADAQGVSMGHIIVTLVENYLNSVEKN